MYRGHCFVHRAEVMQFRGEWSDALDETKRAADRLPDPGLRMMGAAVYLRAELHRLRGEFADAENTYREANEHGRDPQPGLALLRLAKGNIDAAVAAIRRVVDEAEGPIDRIGCSAPSSRSCSRPETLTAARAAADELTQFSTRTDRASRTGHGRARFGRGARCEWRRPRRVEAAAQGVDDLARARSALRGGLYAGASVTGVPTGG